MISMTIDEKVIHSGDHINSYNLLESAQNAYEDHDWRVAIELLEDFIQSHRGNPRIYYMLAQCYEAVEDHEKANEYYRRC
jgi:Tfp pilus assembly protein PilF